MSYDIIGDIHGHADTLEALLRMLDYRDTGGAWRHPDRQAIFVGDFVDRGPAQVQAITIARRMVDRDLMVAATDEDEAEKDTETPSVFKAVECLTKGIELPLPDGHQFQDSYGHWRRRVRVRWWDEAATTFRRAAMLSASERAALPDSPIPASVRLGGTEKPVFFGHYWLTGTPAVQTARHACVDYSAGKGGPLVAYRFDSEPELSPERLVWVD